MAQSQSSHISTQLNKKERADLANRIVNHTIPALLENNERAARGVRESRLFRGISDLRPLPKSNSTPTAAERQTLKISFVPSMTYDVAHSIRKRRPDDRIAVLNMASPIGPGGGVLRGAKAQEEYLCMQSTLFPSLKKKWYRLPEDAVIWTEDVLVFGEYEGDGSVKILDEKDMWYVDVVSCAAVRKPALKDGLSGNDEDYANPQDETRMREKLKYVLRACVNKGARVVVLGAWGCGAYRNPVMRVSKIMKNCLVGGESGLEEDWAAAGIEEIVFAIVDETPEKKKWAAFVHEFKDVAGVVIEEEV